MDINRIKYTQQLIKNKIRIEKEIDAINVLIDDNMEGCEHLEVKVTDGSSHSTRCLFCGKKLIVESEESIKIDACGYKQEEYGQGYRESDKLARLNDLRGIAIDIMTLNPEIPREELITQLNKTVEKQDKILNKIK